MPTRPSKKAAAQPAEPAAASPESEPEAAADPTDAAESAESADPADSAEAPLNRAERRAKARGKSLSQTQPSGRSKVGGAHGPAQGPRMWSNRRSGS